MLEKDLKQWLDREESPSDFYQLVGQPRLCDDRDLLLECLEEASEYLFQYQNHKNKRIRDRARTFSRQLAEARRTLSDPSRWEQYDVDLISRLHEMYRKNPSFSGSNPKLEDLKRWLALVQQVNPGRVEELVTIWTSESAQKETKSQAKTEMETQSHATGNTTNLSKVHERQASSHISGNRHRRASDDSDTYQLAEVSCGDEESQGPQTLPRSTPPPPPSRGMTTTSRDLNANGKAPPPPPPKDLPSQLEPPVVPQIQRPDSELYHSVSSAKRSGTFASSPALWIVLAAFLTAVILGMFGLVIAWAAGAFDGNRSRGAISKEGASLVLTYDPPIPLESQQTKREMGNLNSRVLCTRHSA